MRYNTLFEKFIFEKTFSDHYSDHGSKNDSGHEIGKPVDGQRNADADI